MKAKFHRIFHKGQKKIVLTPCIKWCEYCKNTAIWGKATEEEISSSNLNKVYPYFTSLQDLENYCTYKRV